MALLAGKAYDPASIATFALSSLSAITALDTTNLRLTFAAPANGSVLVRQRGAVIGATSTPMWLMGVLDGATVLARTPPMGVGVRTAALATAALPFESLAVVTGLTPAQNYTWDAAAACQVVVAASSIRWGGPDDSTTNNAWGAYTFEVWEASNLLAGTLYDPGTAVTSKAINALQPMTAIDTTNLRLTFIAPASGNVVVRLRTLFQGTTGAAGTVHLGVLDGATVKARQVQANQSFQTGVAVTTDYRPLDALIPVTGLTPTLSYTWDAAYAVEIVGTAGYNISYGGPNDASGANAWGGFAFEIWSA